MIYVTGPADQAAITALTDLRDKLRNRSAYLSASEFSRLTEKCAILHNTSVTAMRALTSAWTSATLGKPSITDVIGRNVTAPGHIATFLSRVVEETNFMSPSGRVRNRNERPSPHQRR